MNEIQYFDTVIVGAGPAGLGPIVHAMKAGLIKDFLNQKILVVEKTSKLGPGDLGNHIINSDTPASVFLEIMDGHAAPYFSGIHKSSHTQAIIEREHSFVPLAIAGKFLEEMGDIIERLFNSSPASDIRRNSSVNKITIRSDGSFLIDIYNTESDKIYSVVANKIVLACGAKQREIKKIETVFGCKLDLKKYPTLMSSDVLKGEGISRELISKINSGEIKRISILGSSHSAFSSALVLLKNIVPTTDVKIDILFRREPKVFYSSADEARVEGYVDFTEQDICPKTNRVFRFAGLRMESRDLLRSMLNLGGSKKDNRLQLVKIEENNQQQLDKVLSASDQVIVAFGYDFTGVPVFDAEDKKITLGTDDNKFVDQQCRVLARDGSYINNLYGIGLASGYVPDGGGEKSFFGQTNSLWIYQNPAGKIIFDSLRDAS